MSFAAELTDQLKTDEPQLRHVVSTTDLSNEKLLELFHNARILMEAYRTREGRRALRELCSERYVLSLFGEESSRTRISSEKALAQLGVNVRSVAGARQISSFAKGESFPHGARVFTGYGFDAIYVRWNTNDAAEIAAGVSEQLGDSRRGLGAVVNCGCGTGEHPTQAGLDQYLVQNHFGQQDGLTYVLVGDLKHGRTVHSGVEVISRFAGNRIIGVAHEEVALADDDPLRKLMADRGIEYVETTDLMGAIREADIVGATRIQLERIQDASLKAQLQRQALEMQIRPEHLDAMHEDAILMHPLPINTEKPADETSDAVIPEIATECDTHPKAKYFEQSDGGLDFRQALSYDILRWDTA